MRRHSELMSVYPWGETTPSQTTFNLPDTGAVRRQRAGLPRAGHAAGRQRRGARLGRRWSAARCAPAAHRLGAGHRGPQGAVICPASGPDAPTQPDRCDDTAYGKGTGGQLTLRRQAAGRRRDHRLVRASPAPTPGARAARRSELRRLLADPAAALRAKIDGAQALGAHTQARPARRPAARSAASSGASRTSPTPCRRRATCSCATTNARHELPGADRHGSRRRAGSAPASPTTRGCSPPTASTPPSRRVAHRPVRSHQGPPAGAARRQRASPTAERQGRPRGRSPTARSTSAPTPTPATPTRPPSSRAPSR